MESQSTGPYHRIISLFVKPDQPQSQNPGRSLVFDDMRALACLCVVIYHAAGTFSKIRNIPAHVFDWWVGNVYTGLALNFLAPVFFIISGAIFLSPDRPEEDIPTFIKKRARAILPPFLAASLVYYLYTHWIRGPLDLLDFLVSTFGRPQYYHLWFFYTLIGLYLLVPVLRPIYKDGNQNRIEYMLVMWVTVTAVVPLIERFTPIRITIFPTAFLDYTGYFLFGGYFFNLRRWTIRKPWAVGLPILMTLVTTFGTWSLSLTERKFDNFFGSQIGLNIIISTVCLVSMFTQNPLAGVRARVPAAGRVVQTLSRQSLYIYIFHPMLNELLPYGLPFLQPGGMNLVLRVPLTALLSVTLITCTAELVRWAKSGIERAYLGFKPI